MSRWPWVSIGSQSRPQWMLLIDMGTVMSRTNASVQWSVRAFSRWIWKGLPSLPYIWVWMLAFVHEMCTVLSLPKMFMAWRLFFPYKDCSYWDKVKLTVCLCTTSPAYLFSCMQITLTPDQLFIMNTPCFHRLHLLREPTQPDCSFLYQCVYLFPISSISGTKQNAGDGLYLLHMMYLLVGTQWKTLPIICQ